MRKGVRGKLPAISYQQSAVSLQRFACSLKHIVCILFFASFLIPDISYAQSASASIDREKILLGEQVTLELKAENINTQTSSLVSWFLLPDTINHVEVIKRLRVDTVSVNGTTSYIQTITITSFDSGDWKLPPLYVVLQKANDKKDTLLTSDITLQVLPVDVSNLRDYHPMKDIIDVDVKPDYLLMAGIILSVLIILTIIWFLLKKKKEKPTLQPVAAQSLFETAMSQLEKLGKENPPTHVFYNRLHDICRTFIQNQLHIRAMQLTADELMVQMNVYMQPEARASFYQLLRLISAVKFAKYQPADTQKGADIRTAKEAVEHIYYNLQRNLAQHAK